MREFVSRLVPECVGVITRSQQLLRTQVALPGRACVACVLRPEPDQDH